MVVALLAWIYFRSYDAFMLALDRASALGPCHDANGVRPLCDFANHYYPQGLALAKAPVVVHGFYYSAFFAVCMRALATFGYPIAQWLWGATLVAATLVLLFAPLSRVFRTSLRGCLIYGVIFACALPIWHDLAFGQLSAITTALILHSLLAYAQRRPVLSALLIGLATSIKFYPGLFLVYFVIRRDWRAVGMALVVVVVCMGIVPFLLLGDAGFLVFHRSLGVALDQFANFIATSPFSNFIANAVSHVALGRVEPSSTLYQGAFVLGLVVASFHAYLVWRKARIEPSQSIRAAIIFGFASVPFVVRSSWVHYFVFLPLLQVHVMEDTRAPVTRGVWRGLALVSASVSAVLISAPWLCLVRGQSYYQDGWPFWATAVLLPWLYVRALTIRPAAGKGKDGERTEELSPQTPGQGERALST